MEPVQFDENSHTRPFYETKEKGMSAWVIRHSGGLIKTKRQADIVLIVVVVVAFAAAFLFWPRERELRLSEEDREYLKNFGTAQEYDTALFGNQE